MPKWAGDQKKSPGKGWRGPQGGGGQPGGYAWQGKPKQSASRGRGPRRSWIAGWRLYAFLGAVLLSLFVSFLLFGPAKTPLVLVVGEEYAAPVPPNAWVEETRKALADLQHTLVVSEVKGSWQGTASSDAYKAFREHLERHRALRRGFRRIREPLVIYISMPGVVDAQGRPCLLPPGASPLTSDDWLAVETIIAQIEDAVPAERTKLLVLDSCQHLISWRMGIAYNTFVERLQALVEGSSARNLAVMTAAAAGQRSYGSPEMGGALFGQFFRLGVAGAADRAAESPDQKVTLNELASYVRTEVGRWARHNRGGRQEPALFRPRGDEHDFFVSHVLADDTLAEYRQHLADGRPVSSTVSLEEIEGLWQQLDDLRQRELLRYDPISLARFERQLLRVEQLAFAGDGCAAQAEGLAATADEQMRRAAERGRRESPALADHWRVGNPDDAEGARLTTGMHSCRLREYFGQSAEAAAIESFWQQIATRKSVRADPSVLQSALPLATTQLVVAAAQQGVLDAQQNAQQLLAAVDRRVLADALAVPWATIRSNAGKRLPGDERAHYFARVALEAADRDRRLAEDHLFVHASQGAEPSPHGASAERKYRLAEEIGEKASELLHVCDQANAEAPYLAEHICSATDAADRREIEKLVSYLQATRQLTDALGGLGQLPAPDDDLRDVVEELTSAAAELPQLRAQYRADLHGSYEHLGAGVSGSELAIIEAALATPLIEAAARRDLLEKREKLARTLHRTFFEQSAAGTTERGTTSLRDETSSDSSDSPPSLHDAMAKWPRSPLLELLDVQRAGENAETAGAARFEAVCWAARSKLRHVGRLQEPDAPSDADDVVLTRLPLSRSERDMRVAAALCSEFPEHDPIARLRTYDLQQLLLWHARRALNDFWDYAVDVETATAEDLLAPNVMRDPSASTFFFDAARNYAAGVEAINSTYKKWFHGSIPVQLERLEGDLETALQAAEVAVQLRVRPELNLDRGEEIAVDLEASPGASEVPKTLVGQAAVYLADGSTRLATASTRSNQPASLALPLTKTAVDRVRARAGDETELDAIAFFRGHRYRQPFVVDPLEGAVVSYRRPVYHRQSVTLFGSQPKPPVVVFILDCSNSMKELIKAELPGLDDVATRLDVAVHALKTMVSDLAGREQEKPRVGLFFFGHRRAFARDPNNPKDRNYYLRDSKYAEDFYPVGTRARRQLEKVAPGEDVERVLALGEFRAEQRGKMRTHLDAVRYFGMTPVNLAIIRALQEFAKQRVDDNMSVIVITDGENDQKEPRNSPFNVTPVSSNLVVDAWRRINKKIPVFIVGFGIPKDEVGKKAVKSFEEVAFATAGDVTTADSGAELIAFLKKRLDLNGYVVRQPGTGRSFPADPVTGEEVKVELNTRIAVPKSEVRLPVELEVEFQEAAENVTLEGGEALQLEVDSKGDIVARPYDVDVADNGEVELERSDTGRSAFQLLRIHNPRRRGDRVTFRTSIQHLNSHFTPRPEQVWIEVSPEGFDRSYLFYDPIYEPNTPVPVVGFEASGWPDDANYAQVKFWCSDKVSDTLRSIRLTTIQRRDVASAIYRDTGKGIKVRIAVWSDEPGRHKVQVDEQVTSDEASIGDLRVATYSDNASLQPEFVSRLFDREAGLARHTFEFESRLSPEAFDREVFVQLTLAKTIKQDSVRIPDQRGRRIRIVNEDAAHDPTNLGSLD